MKKKQKQKPKQSGLLKKLGMYSTLIIGCLIAGYFLAGYVLQLYITFSAKRLIKLEEKGRLSKNYGYVWSEINLNKTMMDVNQKFTGDQILEDEEKEKQVKKKKKILDLPSLSAIKELKKLDQLSNVIRITDRYDYPLAEIKTTHNLVKLQEVNPFLREALIVTEDKNFFTRKLAYEPRALIRAVMISLWRSLIHFKLIRPRGASTIHQQVARFLLLKFDERGYAYAEKSIRRKIKELKIAQALMIIYSHEDILEIYINHCISAGKNMVGFHDISQGLFNCSPGELDTCRSLYLARLVKWNNQVPEKIIRQVKINLPRLAKHFQWSKERMKKFGMAMDTITFHKPKQIKTEHSHLLDLANEYWLMICEKNGMTREEIYDMDISRPGSLIRNKGNFHIRLHLDMRLQRLLEKEVNARGYGTDTVIYTDIRIGSHGQDIQRKTIPPDTMRLITVLDQDSVFSESGKSFSTNLSQGDTLITNIRYRKNSNGTIRRSVFFYQRDTLRVPGQYYAYAIMNAQSNKLLAYYSRDRLGSKASSLIRYRVPNGSAVAKPIIFALNYDLGIYDSTTMLTDSQEVADSLPWARKFLITNHDTSGMIYLHTNQEEGYQVQNHHRGFDGYDFAFNHLTRSNNILTVEGIYRLNTRLKDHQGKSLEQAQSMNELLIRINCNEKYQSANRINGAQLLTEIAVKVSPTVDSTNNKMQGINNNYSVALGTLELSLYEQLHLFNVLYANALIDKPERHPSLVIKDIYLAGKRVEFTDTIVKYQLFSDINNIRPVQLALHKRLISNPQDRLSSYDIDMSEDDYENSHYIPHAPLSNFAKSGTTDDIIRPYNRDASTKERTNYGLWNAVLRISLTRNQFLSLNQESSTDTISDLSAYSIKVPLVEDMDITLACIGECNFQRTGNRDGKSLHKFLSQKILHNYGIQSDEYGFYNNYFKHLYANTPDSVRLKYLLLKSDLSSYRINRLLRKVKKKRMSEIDDLRFVKWPFVGLRLEKKSYVKMLSFGPYMGVHTTKYVDLVEKLKRCRYPDKAQDILNQIKELKAEDTLLQKDIDLALTRLEENLEEIKIEHYQD